jgi:polyribonucleotide nucleotidyltransferase
VIGPKGKNIQALIQNFQLINIDIGEDGSVQVLFFILFFLKIII